MAKSRPASTDPIPSGKISAPSELGRAIRSARKAHGVTLVDAAGLAGVGVRFLSELERGKSSASLGKTLQVLQRLGLEVWVYPRGKAPLQTAHGVTAALDGARRYDGR